MSKAEPKVEPTDTERLDWLNEDRLESVRWRIINEGGSVREAIDWLMFVQENSG